MTVESRQPVIKPDLQIQVAQNSSDFDKDSVNLSQPFYSDLDWSKQAETVEFYLQELGALKIDPEAAKYKEKALCLTMCSEQEFYNRSEVEKGSISNFEQSKVGPFRS